ncbi:MAG: glycosyltransferase family 9 protein [bacterium]
MKRAAALAADAIVGPLAPLLVRHAASSGIPASPRVLVIRCDHLGDAAMATAVLRPLRDALRPATLDVLAGPWAAPIFEGHPAVDRVIQFTAPWWSAARGASLHTRAKNWIDLPRAIREVRSERYDVAIDLRGDLRQIVLFLALGGMPVRVSSDRTGGRRLLTHVWPHDASKHEVEKNFAIAALVGATGAPHLDIVPAAVPSDAMRALLTDGSIARRYAAFALHGSEPNRSWPAANAAAVADVLFKEHGLASVYLGAAADTTAGDEVATLARSPVINLAGRTTIAEALTLLQHAAVTIAVDSGPMHLATAVGSPVVALFGPGDRRECGPWTGTAETAGNAQVVTVGSPCGCVHRQCDYIAGPGRCMRAIGSNAVIDAVRAVLNQRERTARL